MTWIVFDHRVEERLKPGDRATVRTNFLERHRISNETANITARENTAQGDAHKTAGGLRMPRKVGPRIVYLTAGAAGMICGSCLHDNTLAAAMIDLGVDFHLIPTYTPIRTDETDVSEQRVFLGGVNMYLQERYSIFRWMPLVAFLVFASKAKRSSNSS